MVNTMSNDILIVDADITLKEECWDKIDRIYEELTWLLEAEDGYDGTLEMGKPNEEKLEQLRKEKEKFISRFSVRPKQVNIGGFNIWARGIFYVHDHEIGEHIAYFMKKWEKCFTDFSYFKWLNQEKWNRYSDKVRIESGEAVWEAYD